MTDQVWNQYWRNDRNHHWWKNPAPEVVEFIQSLSSKQRLRVLDYGCGLGRHTIAFAQAGHQVTAVDRSEVAILHLNEWTSQLGLSVEAQVCDRIETRFDPGSFDVVLSYNVIYHGFREQFIEAIDHMYTLLKPGGLFFFTCPTRQDGKYGFGEEVAPHTYRCTKSITSGDFHYFADEHDLDELLHHFKMISHRIDEGYWDHKGKPQFFSNWIIIAENR